MIIWKITRNSEKILQNSGRLQKKYIFWISWNLSWIA